MPRDRLLLSEMVEAGERIVALVGRLDPDQPEADRDLLDAMLWNFMVLGEASGQVSAQVKAAHPEVAMGRSGPAAEPDRSRLLVG